jgi:alkanesulfonate monooxygenase SsuD/methylene tetrahydromethanopterin reductase-like flavin-dependent oxidoreductase (luciferase family)
LAHFTAFLSGIGYHESAWKLADPALLSGPALAGPAIFGVLQRAAAAAERGLLDAVFFADSPGLAIFRARYFPQVGFDPLELLAALSQTTGHVGLIATASTTYSQPYDLARRLSTIDHLSGGRAGWNIVTTRYAGAAGNFGLAEHPAHAEWYDRAAEFVEVVSRQATGSRCSRRPCPARWRRSWTTSSPFCNRAGCTAASTRRRRCAATCRRARHEHGRGKQPRTGSAAGGGLG